MSSGTIQTFVVLQERTPVFADTEMNRMTASTSPYLARGATFSGQTTGKNNTVWLADGSGFVSGEAAAPCYRYSVSAATRVLQDRRLDALQAEGGTAFKRPGEQFDAALVAPGWLWLTSGLGYIPADAAQIVGVGQASAPAGAQQVGGQRIYEVQPNDTLSDIAARFYNGDQSRADMIYSVPANYALIGPDRDMIQPGMRLIIP